MPKILHVLDRVSEIAVHEANQEKLLRFMETILVAKVFITEQSFLVIWMVVENIFFIIKIDVFFNAAHVFRPQLHSVSDKLDLSPKYFVVYVAQKRFFLFILNLFSIRIHTV